MAKQKKDIGETRQEAVGAVQATDIVSTAMVVSEELVKSTLTQYMF